VRKDGTDEVKGEVVEKEAALAVVKRGRNGAGARKAGCIAERMRYRRAQ
jgi:hypothetical protein